MDIWQKILTKEEINTRFYHAVNAILVHKLVPNKASLAESLGVKPAKFSEILNGRMNVGVDMISIMCDLYGISPDWILMCRGKRIFRNSELPEYAIDEDTWEKAPSQSTDVNTSNNPLIEILREKDVQITRQAETIGALKEQIKQLQREKGKDVSDVQTSGVANAV